MSAGADAVRGVGPAATAARSRLALLARAAGAILCVRALLWRGGLPDARRWVRSRPRGTARGAAAHDHRVVAWSVRAAARLVPGATCLTQALAGQSLLRGRGRGSTVRVGVRPEGAGPALALAGHAWLIADGKVLLGGADSLARHAIALELTVDADEPTERAR